MERALYPNGKKFETVDDLETVVAQAWSEVSTSYIKNLYSSITNRLNSVIEQKGHIVDYSSRNWTNFHTNTCDFTCFMSFRLICF